MRAPFGVLAAFAPLAACRTDATGSTELPLEERQLYDAARLVILAPEGGAYLPWQEPAEFSAALFAENGDPIAFTDVVWSSDTDPSWVRTGAALEDATLEVGVHTLTALATLPTGSRITATVGGIRVQHPDAGLYVGPVRIDVSADVDGQPTDAGCFGIATMSVDVRGETIQGQGGCDVAVAGFEVAVDLDLEPTDIATDGSFSGSSLVDLGFFQIPLPIEGNVGDGAVGASFQADLLGASVAGTVDLPRVSRNPEGEP